MTPEDLEQARLHRWHQDGNPILTTEAATEWLDQVGFCSLLPGEHPLAALAQATAGTSDRTPAREAQDTARQLTAQLLQSRTAVPMLWEEKSELTGELYDAIASVEVLPYLYCLRGDRDLKKAPAGSPLVLAVWEQLQSGPKTVAEIVTGVGRELTEAAVLRALRELWEKLRVLPVLELHASSEGATWDLLPRVFPDAVKQGATMSQPLALSALVSVYLDGSVAATADEVEDALGPLASRSRVREVLHALQATRQLKMFPVGRSSAYALAGGSAEVLDEVAEKRDTDALKIARLEAKLAERSAPREGAGKSPREFGERKAFVKREGIAARTRPRRDDAGAGDATPADRERKEWKPRPAGAGGFADRKPYVKREGAGGDRKPYVKREGAGGDRKPYVKREGAGSGEKREWKPRAAGAGAGASAFGTRKPFVKREGPDGERKPYVRRDAGAAGEKREWKPRAAGAGFGDRKPPAFGDRKPYVKRDSSASGEKREWKPRAPGTGEKREWKPRPAGTGASGDRRFDRKPFVKRDSADAGERKPWARREAGAARSSRPAPAAGERREWKARPAAGERSSSAAPRERKPFGAKPFGAKKPFGSKPSGPRSFGSKPGGPRSFGSKPGAKPFGKKPFGAKPGGARPPFRKKPEGRKDDAE